MKKVYYVSRTLLGGADVNCRYVTEAIEGPDGKPLFSSEVIICIINPDMKPWTIQHMRLQDVILSTLRGMASEPTASPS